MILSPASAAAGGAPKCRESALSGLSPALAATHVERDPTSGPNRWFHLDWSSWILPFIVSRAIAVLKGVASTRAKPPNKA